MEKVSEIGKQFRNEGADVKHNRSHEVWLACALGRSMLLSPLAGKEPL